MNIKYNSILLAALKKSLDFYWVQSKLVSYYKKTYLRIEQYIPEEDKNTNYLGNRFTYPSKSAIGKFIADGGEWDGRIFRKILPHILPSNPTIIEVGANIGASTLLLHSIFNDAQFLLIEPSDRFFKYLVKNTAHLNIIGLDRHIISNQCKENALLRTNYTTGTPSKADYGKNLVSSQIIETITIDSLCDEYKLRSIDFLKVDTDGFELEVFHGATKTIRHFKPLIHAEFSPPSLLRMHPDHYLITLLHDYGCGFFLVFKSDGRYAGLAKSYDEIIELKEDDYYIDLICAPVTSKYEGLLMGLASNI